MLAKAITDSALSLSHLIPEPLSRSVRQSQNDSVGPEPIQELVIALLMVILGIMRRSPTC